MKRILSLLIILILGLSVLPAAAGAAGTSSWATPYLNNSVDRAVMKGDPDGQLYPHRTVTRAEFAAMVRAVAASLARSWPTRLSTKEMQA